MLPLLTSRCFMAIDTAGIALAQAPAFGRRVYDKQYYPFDEQLTKNTSAFYAKLNSVLAKHSKQQSQQLQVVLSADFIRFMVLPAQTKPLNASDRLAFARALYQDVYGTLSDAWLIATDDAPPQQSTLCAAIDHALFEQLESMSIEHRYTLSSVVPYATTLINRCNLQEYDGYLAVVEPTRLVLMDFKGGVQNLQHTKWVGDWVSPLNSLLNKTMLRNGLNTQDLTVYAPVNNELEASQFANFKLTHLKPIPSLLGSSIHYQILRVCL